VFKPDAVVERHDGMRSFVYCDLVHIPRSLSRRR
jgi:hypothetical protein